MAQRLTQARVAATLKLSSVRAYAAGLEVDKRREEEEEEMQKEKEGRQPLQQSSLQTQQRLQDVCGLRRACSCSCSSGFSLCLVEPSALECMPCISALLNEFRTDAIEWTLRWWIHLARRQSTNERLVEQRIQVDSGRSHVSTTSFRPSNALVKIPRAQIRPAD